MKTTPKKRGEKSVQKYHFEVEKIPLCSSCGENMTEKYDEIAKSFTGHLWWCEKCYPKFVLSIG